MTTNKEHQPVVAVFGVLGVFVAAVLGGLAMLGVLGILHVLGVVDVSVNWHRTVEAPVVTAPVVPPARFTFAGENAQGYEEYTHDETGIVFVRLPGNAELEPFLIAKHEVTQAEYEEVMGSNPSHFTGDAQRPVEQVSWDDLKAANGFLARTGLFLPSEAQWEYAARGGTTTEFSWGDECNVGGCDPCTPAVDHMWWCGNSGNTTHPVGEKLPNPFGLHDVHGNVWEWCEDQFSPGSGSRVIRGGRFGLNALYCRSALRNDGPPSFRYSGIGFRPARPLP